MFYSHEVLTSRKYGVATVWLVATLGAKSSLKRIKRKQILDVDVAKACSTIVDPVMPMALRLQGNLLYGVSRVYLQQCGYVLADAQEAHNTIRMLLRTVEDAALDPEAGKARREQLVLPDDPSFLPEFALPPPELLAQLENGMDSQLPRFAESQSLTPFGSQQHSESSQVAGMGLILPSSSPNRPGDFRVEGDNGIGTETRSAMFDSGDPMDLDEPDFMFSADGDIVQLTPAAIRSGTPAMQSGTGASAKVRREHEEGLQGDDQMLRDQADDDLPMYGDDVIDGEAFPARESQPHSEHYSQSSERSEIIESTSTVTAPMRRKKRAARTLATDATVELRSRDLVDWNTNYLDNMNEASRAKNKKRMLDQAKKNAEHYLWGAGLGGIASQMAGAVGPTPFDRFIGDNLFELFTGVNRRNTTGKKHDRDSGIDEATQAEGRRVRRKLDESEDQLGRGEQDEGVFLGANEEVELPRESASALDDQEMFSAMPWNTSASVRGSSVLPRSGRPGMIGDQAKPGHRMVSASPLLRYSRTGYLEGLESLKSDGEFYADDEFALPAHDSDTSEALALSQPSVRVREALSAEGGNFVSFVADAIAEKREAEPAVFIDSITFEELLPPVGNNKVIACQGLMMVLALGTKDILDVQQLKDFGDIGLKLKQQVKTPQVIDISDEQGSEYSMAIGNDESGHFAEQYAAGHAAAREDDQDSLYDD